MIDLIKKIASYKTYHKTELTDEFDKLFSYIKEELSPLPLSLEEFEFDGYKSQLWYTTKNPELLLAAHIDVVPAKDSSFIIKEDNGKLFGRGVLDMKFAVAIFIRLLKEMPDLQDRSIGILLTSDEEIGGFNGTKAILEKTDLAPKCVLLPDGGADFSIEASEKGVLHVDLKASGKTAHGSRPWLGDNAIDKLIKGYIAIKERFPNPTSASWVTTTNAGKIEGGSAFNVIPDKAILHLDIRIPSEEERDKVKQALNEVSNSVEGLSYHINIEGESFNLPRDNKFLLKYLKIAESVNGEEPKLINSEGSSDARFFAKKNIPVIISRPIGFGHHQEDEWIDIESLEKYYLTIKKFVEDFNLQD